MPLDKISLVGFFSRPFMWVINKWKQHLEYRKKLKNYDSRIAHLEERSKTADISYEDIKEGLAYNKILNIYEDRVTGENFCPTCLGNKKRVAIQIKNDCGRQFWNCRNCNSYGSNDYTTNLPRNTEDDWNPFK